MTTPIERYAQFLRTLNETRLTSLSEHVTQDVAFSDPFNRVQGIDKMQQIFADMYATIGHVQFDILHQAQNGDTGFLHWQLSAQLRGKPWVFEGVTHVQFNAVGKVVSHADHWDAAREFYEHFPVIGWALGAIRRKLAL